LKNFPQLFFEEKMIGVISPKQIQLLSLFALLTLVLVLPCLRRARKANVRQEQANAGQPATVDVSTAPAIVRDSPQYFLKQTEV